MGFFSSFFGGDKTAKQAAAKATAEETARQGRISSGLASINQQFGGFDDNWFNQRAQEYTDYALPTFNMELARTRNNLSYGLASRGMLNSSVRNQRQQSLENERQKQLRVIADTGIGQANDLRAKLEDNRSRITSQLYQSADPANASASAARASADISRPSPMGAVGNFFNDWAQIYTANQTARAENPNTQPLFDWGSFKGGSSKLIKG